MNVSVMADRVPRTTSEAEESVYTTIVDLVDDLAEREAVVDADIPEGYETAGVDDHLRRPLEQWETGEKPIRTVPAIHVWEAIREERLPEQVERLLTGLDVVVTAMDDVVDTPSPSKRERITLTAVIAFSGLLSFSNIPERVCGAVTDELTQYLLEIAQIPAVERETIRRLNAAKTVADEIETARFCYAYRARDIDAFATVPALVFDVDPGPVLEDLRTFRARELLYEDVVDVERDLEDRNDSPYLRLARKHGDVDAVRRRFEALLEAFSYSEQAAGDYRERLLDLEDPPEDLKARFEHAVDLVP